jgi:CspA family cold shock protein
MASGTIEKLVSDKGFGFIQTADGTDIFFHHSAVQNAQFDDLTEGQEVEYTVEQGQGPKGKGPRAASVTPVWVDSCFRPR